MDKWIQIWRSAVLPEFYGPSATDCREMWQAFGIAPEEAEECLPVLRAALERDLQAALERDPAASSREEVALCYPGFFAVTAYRLAHMLHGRGVPVWPRRVSEHAHSVTGIDIHPGAVIGPGFFIDHGTGVVIGETAVIGKNVTLYHGVTLGALATRRDWKGVKRHPTLEDGVTVYANATVLGGETVIGHGCVIGAGAFVSGSVPPNTVVTARHPETVLRKMDAGHREKK